ncbi:MAG: 50S ribosomal protein L6 [Candidatus Colwellbacteria bacterium]|nr:50S ribosomal protein L6 [Candidatus Colwellbacteria bacterium]
MSKIGNKPINIPAGVDVRVGSEAIEIKGPNASLQVPILRNVEVEVKDGQVRFSIKNENTQSKSDWGTMRALVQNAVSGSTENFVKTLILEGVGFRASMEGEQLIMNLGFSHPVKFLAPENVKIEVDGNFIKVSGADKSQVGEAAANIRKLKKPEPYKGKGIRYADEVIRRKAGKKAVSGSS